MNIIILSGGSGKRLWPLSNGVRAKQFLRVLPGEEGAESMMERMVRRLRKAFPEAAVTVAAPEYQLPQIRSQLGSEISVCIEPMQRGTFSAVALACAFLHEGGVSPEEAVLAESENTHVINELKTPLIVLGIDHAIRVNSSFEGVDG